jgi:hypothetical protein
VVLKAADLPLVISAELTSHVSQKNPPSDVPGLLGRTWSFLGIVNEQHID